METVEISEIGVDPEGRLYVVPVGKRFDHIYRAAMEVSWDKDRRRLFTPHRTEWSYPRWFAQVQAAIADEYNCRLEAGQNTVWTNIPEGIKAEILNLS